MPIKRTLFLLATIAALQYPLWVGKGNVKEVRELGTQVTNSKTDVEKLELRNRALTAQIQDLKQGQEAVAEIARDELGYISNGEHYYRIKP